VKVEGSESTKENAREEGGKVRRETALGTEEVEGREMQLGRKYGGGKGGGNGK
jgi:hypothetical protein